jgi:hypothetical protein
MGIKDVVGKAKEKLAENTEAAKQGVDKAGDIADSKTGGKYADKVDKGQDAAKDALNKMKKQ